MDVSFSVTLGFFSIAAVLWYIWRKRRMTLFERLGIPGPKPHFITGNVNNSSEHADLSLEWEKIYGKIYGVYMGAWPFLVVSDVELLKLIQIKEFKTFSDRAKFLGDVAVANTTAQEGIFSQSGDKWKNARSAITPAFTTGKLKKMMPIVTEAIDIFLKKIAETNGKTFDVVPLFKRMSFDVNSRASFGISTGVQINDDSLFIRSVYRSFDADSNDIFAKAIIYFPELHPLPKILRRIREKLRTYLNFPSATNIVDTCAQIIKMRRENPEAARQDLLQGLIDASKETANNNQNDKTGTSPHVPITETEVLANAFGFMLAGFDAISTMMSFCVHYLIENPEVQEKLRNEIKTKVKGKVDYDNLSNLQYLDQVISETLRIFPFTTIGVNRTSIDDYQYKGMTIPKGMNIGIALHALNMDPTYWKEPEAFRPERFSLENGDINPSVYQPFGSGPRNCIGMRFAQVVMKTIMASLIQNYKLVNPPDAKKFELTYTVFMIRPKNGVEIQAIPV